MPAKPTFHESTFYHYQLIRKITLRPEAKYSYMVTALLGSAALSIVYGWHGLEVTAGASIVMLIVHAFVVRITLRRVDEPSEKTWTFRRDWPWIGPLPVMDTNLSLFRKLHYHLALIGCCVAGLFYPWSHSAWVVALLFWHFWLLSPRFKLLWRTKRERGDGVIRLESSEVSYYHR
jgi:hypothetical protein